MDIFVFGLGEGESLEVTLNRFRSVLEQFMLASSKTTGIGPETSDDDEPGDQLLPIKEYIPTCLLFIGEQADFPTLPVRQMDSESSASLRQFEPIIQAQSDIFLGKILASHGGTVNMTQQCQHLTMDCLLQCYK